VAKDIALPVGKVGVVHSVSPSVGASPSRRVGRADDFIASVDDGMSRPTARIPAATAANRRILEWLRIVLRISMEFTLQTRLSQLTAQSMTVA